MLVAKGLRYLNANYQGIDELVKHPQKVVRYLKPCHDRRFHVRACTLIGLLLEVGELAHWMLFSVVFSCFAGCKITSLSVAFLSLSHGRRREIAGYGSPFRED